MCDCKICPYNPVPTTYNHVGTCCQPMIPSLYQPVADPMETFRTIKEIGPDRCIIGSDFGQVLHMDAIDGMRVFIRALLGFGVKEQEVKVMLQDNPAKLMWWIEEGERWLRQANNIRLKQAETTTDDNFGVLRQTGQRVRLAFGRLKGYKQSHCWFRNAAPYFISNFRK